MCTDRLFHLRKIFNKALQNVLLVGAVGLLWIPCVLALCVIRRFMLGGGEGQAVTGWPLPP